MKKQNKNMNRNIKGAKEEISDYDAENDMFYMHFGDTKTNESAQLENVSIVLDFDKSMNVVGFEIMDFMQKIREHQKKMDKILN